jgi:hypothetical protein
VLDAEIARAKSAALAKAQRWDDALLAADEAIRLAPGWPEAWFTRAGIRIGRYGPLNAPTEFPREARVTERDLEDTTWRSEPVRIWEDPTRATDFQYGLRFAKGDAVQCSVTPYARTGAGTYRLTNEAVKVDCRSSREPTWTLDLRIKGGLLEGRENRSEVNVRLRPLPVAGARRWPNQQDVDGLRAAAADLAHYLSLRPGADDRDAVIELIAQLDLRVKDDEDRVTRTITDAGTTP